MEKFKEELKEAKEELNRINGVIETEIDEKIDGEEEKEKGLIRKVKISDGREFIFDFGKLTGNSIIEIKKNYGKLRKKTASLVEELDDFYYMLVAEYVSKYKYTTFLKLSYKDFAKIRDEVKDFLLDD
ncbi:hypothetical protein [Fusobacterium periodonticum]|uniref:Uncharacterized protein n=1 Tax=Fusobacterium periodonticum 1_1_41FAA TaxID=469621 RepID=D6LHL4_9FUSO|nr:hypothetical protein [Fusobacterium periodonticum]EFG27890.1 hypothetical protein HMPREF0400_01222 [Fusobacterium periodonticum 1_1_41FAA]